MTEKAAFRLSFFIRKEINMLDNFKILNKSLPINATTYQKKVIKGEKIVVNGNDYIVDDSFFSRSNSFRSEIQLNPALLRALELVIKDEGSVGLQIADNKANYFVTEVLNEQSNKIVATVYVPNSGEMKQCVRSPKSKRIGIPLAIDGVQSDGIEVWFTLITALLNAELIGGLFLSTADDLVSETGDLINDIRNEHANGNMYNKPQLIYRLQDVLHGGLQTSSIPFSPVKNQARLKEISLNILKSGIYEPNYIIRDGFKILREEFSAKKLMTVKEYGNRFNLGIKLTPEQEARVPNCDNYVVSSTALSIVHSFLNTPHRCVMLGGGAGTGKTTDCMIAAALLGITYGAFSCSEGTDETDIVTKFIPNTSDTKLPEYLTRQMAEEIYEDFTFDPQTAVATLTGEEYNEKLSGGQCLTKIINYFVKNQRNLDKDFLMVPSEIVKGAKEPSLVEIQEVDLIGRPGTIPVLNRLLNEGVVTLSDGTTFKRHPNSYFVFTANLTYEGCRDLNQALKSRCQRIIMIDDLTEADMVSRLTSSPNFEKYSEKNGYTVKEAKKVANELVKVMSKLKTYITDNQISGSVCGYREYEAWFYETLASHSAREAAESTIITHAALEEDMRIEIQSHLNTMLPDDTIINE